MLNRAWSIYINYPTNVKGSFDKIVDESKVFFNSKIFLIFLWHNIQIGPDQHADITRISEIYRSGYGIVNREFAKWVPSKGLEFRDINDINLSPIIWERRSNLSGMLIRGGTVHSPPQQIIKRRLPDGQVELDGELFEIFESLRELTNFR